MPSPEATGVRRRVSTWWLIMVGVVIAYNVGSYGADSPSRQPAIQAVNSPPVRGLVTVDRIWAEFDIGHALVSYQNTTTTTFPGRVTIQCDAFDRSDMKIGTNQRSFFARERGPIAPGFRGTLDIPVNLHGASLKRMECSIAAAI